jgi:hypothetical protein
MQQVFSMMQSIDGCSPTLTLFIEPEIQRLSEDPSNWSKCLGEMVSTRIYHERTDGVAPRSEAESRARFLQCCLRIITMLGPANLDFFTLNWFIEALIDELAMSESAMLQRRFPRQVWLWAALMARAAVSSARHQSLSEAKQAEEWKRITSKSIRLVSDAFNLRNWVQVEQLLRTWVWHDDSLDAQPLKVLWEEAVAGRRQNADGTVAPVFLDKRFCFRDQESEKKPIIVDDEAFDLCVASAWT